MASSPQRAFTDPTGYIGPLRFLEVMLGGKKRPGSGLWSTSGDLTVLVWDAAFTGYPLRDSHGQIAHYARDFELFDKEDPERQAELSARLDEVPHLADFHIDIDFEEPERSQEQALKLVEHYLSLGVPEAAIGIRFSGRKGFDVMVPWQVLGVQRQGVIGLNWHAYKRLAQALIEKLDLQGVDTGLYRRNGTIRLENTLHPSGLYKVRLAPKELRGDLDSILKLAEKPRRPLYTAEQEEAARAASVVGLRSLYLVAQAQADAETMQVRELRQVPLDVQVDGLTPCLSNILAAGPVRGTRNETLFHAAMMLKHIGRSQEEAEEYGRQWLGSAYHTEGGPGTIRSAYHGPFAGGCRWMREHGFAGREECRACPVGQRRFERDARVVDEAPKVSASEVELPTLREQREQLERDFDALDPHRITAIRISPGVGKTHAMLRKSTQVVEQSGRVLMFVKDTKADTSLAADMQAELREVHGYTGKVQVLYGRNERNCDNWSEVEKVEKKGYSAGKVVCPGCMFRNNCDYYGQYESAYEPGIYIAPHAMLPLIFDDERRGFAREMVYHDDDELGSVPIGGPLRLIVIDEDALDVLIDRYWIGSYHLEGELRHKTRWVRDALTKRKSRRVVLDKNWLKVVEWLQAAIRVPGPLLPALNSVAKADGKSLKATFDVIDEAKLVDPDFEVNRGHKPFTERLYLALKRELPRLVDGNFTIWAKGNGLEVLAMRPIAFPPHIPVVVLDAYAGEDIYRRFYRAAGVNRLPTFRDYPVREQPNTTYVLGANLLAGDLERAEAGNAPALAKVERVLAALQALTADGVETYLVAKRSFFESNVWKRWQDKLPNCVAEGDAGTLYFWRGRGINAASGKRVAVLQVPNFHPDSVMQEASLLFADEPRLDDQRVRVEADMVWAADAPEPRAIKTDRTVYADERLNLVNERYRMDELVQMAFRSRSLTTGAEIIVFADLPDPRLPARRVLTVDELVGDESARAGQARQVLYEVMRELGVLSVQNLADLGIVGGQPKPTPLRRQVRNACGDEFRIARDHPIEITEAEEEIKAWLGSP